MKPYYDHAGITIYHGDCLEIMPQLEPVDLVVTSPPYGELRDYGGCIFSFEKFMKIARGLEVIVKDGAIIVWVVGDETKNGSESGESFRQALFFKEIGFNLHDTMIYHKDKPPENANRYEQKFEYMFVFSKGSPRVFNPITIKTTFGGVPNKGVSDRQKDGSLKIRQSTVIKDKKIKGNIWHYLVGFNKSSKNRIVHKHPAIFPEQLAGDHIKSWCNLKDIVLDPMCGSGTVLYMAQELNRKAIGIEIEEKYCEIAAKRLAQEVMAF